jgi:hypothetical protein
MQIKKMNIENLKPMKAHNKESKVERRKIEEMNHIGL